MRLMDDLIAGRKAKRPKYSDEERKIFAASFRIGWTILAIGIVGIIMIFVWAHGAVHVASHTAAPHFLGFLGADLLVAAAAAAAGALFGFIFGIPRTLDAASSAAVATAATRGAPAAASHAVMAANTNLERISDWLTTLLVGATLVQIKDIAKWVGSLGEHLTAGGAAANDAVVPIIVILFFALAFLGVYLITRLYLTSAFQQTLGLLAGAAQAAPDLADLKVKLAEAAKSGTVDDQKAAMAAYEAWESAAKQRDDPELNANVARVLVKLIANKSTADLSGDPVSNLKAAVAKAATDQAVKAKLKTEFASDPKKTGDPTLDQDINTALA